MTKQKKKFSRRKFFKRAGIVLGGTVAVVYFGRHAIRRFVYHTGATMDLPSGVLDFDTDLWFEVMPDNTIKLKSPKVEMGQGIFTGFAMLAAEELDVPVEQIKVVPGSSKDSAADMAGTGGSSSTHSLYQNIREVAATLREMLKLAAAKHWSLDVSQIKTDDGKVFAEGKEMTYAELVEATSEWDEPDTPTLKPRSEFKHIGTDRPRIDLAPKVMGEPIFVLDAELPDMRFAVRLEPAYIGATLKSLDTSEAESFPGVEQVVQDSELVAVVADSRYAAEMGALKLAASAEWDVPKMWQQSDIDELVTVGKSSKTSLQKDGKPAKIFEQDEAAVLRQEYRTPLGAHAHLEPNGVVVHVQADKAIAYAGSQNIGFVQQEIAKATGLSKSDVEIRNSYLGGSFGRRVFKSIATDAARISKITGKPIKLFRTRESEFQNGLFRPATHHVLQGKINEDGRIEAVQHDIATGDMGIRMLFGEMGVTMLGADLFSATHGAKFLYDIEHRHANAWDVKMPVPTTIWRGVGMFQNTFAIESFINELAQKAGQDPLQLRISHLTSDDETVQRMKKALEAAAPAWNAPKPEGVGRGIACGEDRKTPAVAVVEVQQVDGQVRVTKVTQVIDPGIAINPEGIRQQVEGCTMMGISASMYEGLFVEDGQIMNSNFHAYPMASLKDTPEIETIILENSEKPSGVGEPPIAPMAPAIAHAIFELTGERKREIPFFKNSDLTTSGF